MRERQKRYRIKLSAIVVIKDSDNRGKKNLFYTENLSLSGALIKGAYEAMDARLLTGDLVHVTLQLPAIDSGAHEIQCEGKIVREATDGILGLKFEMDDPTRRFLQAYIGKFVAEFPEAII
jgi:hypothetical protein